VDRDEITRLLRELGRRLADRGLVGELYVVGGAAIALTLDARRSTRDIDAVFEPKREIYDLAAAMSEELELPSGWLNDAVKGFLAGGDPDAVPVLDVPGLRCSVASPRILLAMKVLAHRVGEDEEDVRLLASVVGLTSAEEVLGLAEDVYGDRLDIAARFFVEQIFAEADRSRERL
jgi:hypothetical protein